MHRFVWDLHYTAPASTRHEYPIAAIPHDTPRYPLGPTALPGSLHRSTHGRRKNINGAPDGQDGSSRQDTAAGLEKKFQAETRMAAVMTESTQALLQGRVHSGATRETKRRRQVPRPKTPSKRARRNSPHCSVPRLDFLRHPPPTSLSSRVNGEASTLYQQVWQVDAEPTSSQMAGADTTEHERHGRVETLE